MQEDELRDEIALLRAEVKRLRQSLSKLTPSLTALLRRRGFRLFKKEPPGDLLIPDTRHLDDYYRLLHKYSFRLFLRDVIKHQASFTIKDVTRYATQGVTEEYVDFLCRIRLAEAGNRAYSLVRQPVKSFGPTLEWFLSEIFKREFAAEALWGVRFKGTVAGGDYDLIAKIDGSILYMEIKSSPPKQIYPKEITAFLDRVFDLSPEIAVFFMDTELRMKDKIVPMFEDELAQRAPRGYGGFFGPHQERDRPPPLKRIVKELFQIGDKIYIINAKESITANIEGVLSRHLRRV